MEHANQVFASVAKQQVLRVLIRRSPVSHGALVKETDVSAATVTRAIKDLESLGVVRANLPLEQRRGRNASYWLVPEVYGPIYELWSAELSP